MATKHARQARLLQRTLSHLRAAQVRLRQAEAASEGLRGETLDRGERLRVWALREQLARAQDELSRTVHEADQRLTLVIQDSIIEAGNEESP